MTLYFNAKGKPLKGNTGKYRIRGDDLAGYKVERNLGLGLQFENLGSASTETTARRAVASIASDDMAASRAPRRPSKMRLCQGDIEAALAVHNRTCDHWERLEKIDTALRRKAKRE